MKDKIHKIIMEYMSDGEEMTPTDKMLLTINKRICALIDADCISRQDAIGLIRINRESEYKKSCSAECEHKSVIRSKHDAHVAFCDYLIEQMKTLPSVERKGKWIGGELGECSVCGHKGCASDIWTGCEGMYCPNCGADMRGEEE